MHLRNFTGWSSFRRVPPWLWQRGGEESSMIADWAKLIGQAIIMAALMVGALVAAL